QSAQAVAHDAEQPATPFAVARAANELIAQQPAKQTRHRAKEKRQTREQTEFPKLRRPLLASTQMEVIFQEIGKKGDIQIPAVGRAEVHHAQNPEVSVGQESPPGHTGVCGLGRTSAADQLELGLIDARLLLGAIAEPPPEQNAPQDADAAEDP